MEWLRENASEIPFQRAYEAVKIARGLKARFGLLLDYDLASDLEFILANNPDERDIRSELVFMLNAIHGRSKYQLMLTYGGVKEQPKEEEPAAPNTPRQLTWDEILDDKRVEAVNTFAALVSVTENYAHQTLRPDELDDAIEATEAALSTLKEWRDTPQKDRTDRQLREHTAKHMKLIRKK